jgi:hypothetical protein
MKRKRITPGSDEDLQPWRDLLSEINCHKELTPLYPDDRLECLKLLLRAAHLIFRDPKTTDAKSLALYGLVRYVEATLRAIEKHKTKEKEFRPMYRAVTADRAKLARDGKWRELFSAADRDAVQGFETTGEQFIVQTLYTRRPTCRPRPKNPRQK